MQHFRMQEIMAPSKSLLALLFASAVVLAVALQPSEAIRVKPAVAAADEEASGHIAANGGVKKPSTFCPPLPPLPGFPVKPPQSGGSPPSSPPVSTSPAPPLLGSSPSSPTPPSSHLGSPPAPSSPTPPPAPSPHVGSPSLPATPPPPPSTPSPPTPSPSHLGSPPSSPTPPPAPSPQVGSPSLPATPPPLPSQPTECLSSLMGLMPCMGYLTNTTVVTPPTTCCDGFKSLVSTAPICLCHGLNGDINKLMPAPMDFMRMMSLPMSCNVPLPLQTLAQCSTAPVPPLMPPSPAGAPSPRPSS